MKKSLALLFTSLLLLVACSNSTPDSMQSWAYYLVTWNDAVYQMTDEVVTEVESEIGKIKKHSTNESDDLPNLFSNYYKKGTKLFKIKDVETSDSIAVLDNGIYYKANKTISLK